MTIPNTFTPHAVAIKAKFNPSHLHYWIKTGRVYPPNPVYTEAECIQIIKYIKQWRKAETNLERQ